MIVARTEFSGATTPRRDLDPEHAAATVIGAIDGLLRQHLVEPRGLDADALRDTLVHAVGKVLGP